MRNNYGKGNLILTHWGQATHICISKFTIIGSGNGLSPGRRQAIIWSNARILLIQTSGTNFSEIFIKIDAFSFKKMHFNSLGPGDAIWQQRSGSPLAQVMAWCLTAPTHYLNQCWLIIRKVEWHSLITEIIWKIKYLKYHSNFPGTNELKCRLEKGGHFVLASRC